jgi:hypothetical protein
LLKGRPRNESAWKQITLSLVTVYLALFNNIIKGLNIYLNKYLAEIQLPGNGIRLLSTLNRFYTEFMGWIGE